MSNPFIYGRIVEGDQFVNRKPELERLTGNFLSSQNTIIISARRWGKSSLVNKAAKQILQKDRNFIICKLDLFNIRSEKEFYEAYAREVLKNSSASWEEWLENGKKFLKSIIPKFSFGVNPAQEFSVSFDISASSKNVSDILSLPENIAKAKKKKIIVCIDKFQNIAFYEDPLALQKKMRAAWQQHSHVAYCLYGSKRHMITDLFENKSMPFYKFGDTVFLNKIASAHWIDFIVSSFKKTGKTISTKVAQLIPLTAKEHPYFVQQLAQKVWANTLKTASDKTVTGSTDELLHENSILYLREVENLSNTQVNFLRAVCDKVEQFSAAETIRKYNLGTSANVIRIKNSLEQKEVLDMMGAYPEFIDPLFELWMKRIYFRQDV